MPIHQTYVYSVCTEHTRIRYTHMHPPTYMYTLDICIFPMYRGRVGGRTEGDRPRARPTHTYIHRHTRYCAPATPIHHFADNSRWDEP